MWATLLKLTRASASLAASQEWDNKATGYMSSPVVIDGHVYMHLRNQRFTCIDLASGATRWTSTPFGKYWSLVANGDRILALDERGELLLIRANPERFELLDQRKLSDDPTWAHLAVCGDELFVRELNALTAYHWRDVP
jgi:outer membrane protein assembly factor BamB